MNSFRRLRWTRIREPQRQICPAFEKALRTSVGTASSRSASAQTIAAFLPPSSSASRLNIGPALFAIARPVGVPPVKVIVGTSGCSTSRRPAGAAPKTTLRTPRGKPISAAISASRNAVIDASSDGFATTVDPLASAGAIFQVKR